VVGRYFFIRVMSSNATAYRNAEEFFEHLQRQEPHGLPDVIRIVEYGPGNGLYALDFLDRFKQLDREERYYPRLRYLLMDWTQANLAASRRLLINRGHGAIAQSMAANLHHGVPLQDRSVYLIRFNEVYDDLAPLDVIERRGNRFARVFGRVVLPSATIPTTKFGQPISLSELRRRWTAGPQALDDLGLVGFGSTAIPSNRTFERARRPHE
jgi:SAM-dependent MidA family methyltransferase